MVNNGKGSVRRLVAIIYYQYYFEETLEIAFVSVFLLGMWLYVIPNDNLSSFLYIQRM